MHADVGEEFLASILQAGTEDVDHIVDNEKAVVISLAVIDSDGWILLVMTLDVKLELFGIPELLTSIDGSRDVGITIAEHRQGIDVDVVVDEDNGCLGLFDETDDVGVGIEDLSIVEDSFYWWQDHTSTFVLNCSEFPNCCRFLKFSLFIDVFNVLTDVSLT